MSPLDFYIGLAITNIVVLGGWAFSVVQNKVALRRERRVSQLAAAYDTFVRVGIDGGRPVRINANGELDDYTREFERAVATVHLYGTETETELTNIFVRKLTDKNHYSADDLVNALRSDIRKEMGMAALKQTPTYLKQTVTVIPR